jgi:hypothetical protein
MAQNASYRATEIYDVYYVQPMTDSKNKGGRPWLTTQQKTQRKEHLLRRIEPYLCSGLSISKALRAAQIHNSEFYKYMKEDMLFGEKIANFQNYIPVLVCNIIATELMDIAKRQQEAGGLLSKEDADFVWMYALHSNLTTEEYGRHNKVNSFNADEEIQRLKYMLNNQQ